MYATFENFGPGLDYLMYGGKQLSAQRIIGFEPNGVIRPTLVAGRNFTPTDTTGVLLLSKDYANALGFSGDYTKLVGQTVVLHTRPGYTGAGANLPSTLPPQNQCQPGQQNCFGGPTSGLPAVDLSAKVVGVVGSEDGGQGSIVLPLPWMLDLSNQSQPQDVQYAQPRGPQSGPSQLGQPPQPQQPANRPAPGPGTVRGGWTRQDPAQFVVNNGGYSSLLVNVDNADDVAAVASPILLLLGRVLP